MVNSDFIMTHSMQMKHSKCFWQELDQLSTMPFLRLKKCTVPGRRHLRSHGTVSLSLCLKQPWTSWMSTTGEWPSLMPIYGCTLLYAYLLTSYLIDVQCSTQGKSLLILLRIGMLHSRVMSRRWFRKGCIFPWHHF